LFYYSGRDNKFRAQKDFLLIKFIKMDILDLSPYERRNEYFKTVQLGSDVKTQNKLIAQAAKLQLENQL